MKAFRRRRAQVGGRDPPITPTQTLPHRGGGKGRKRTSKRPTRKTHLYPPGWNEKRVRNVIDYYDRQTEDEALAEYEAGMATDGWSVMLASTELVPEVHRLIGHRRGT
jgi:hypothetical protein